ncbi:MAG: hypothetical protein JJU01_07085 [Alkalibacterium sp.]|nr:hypothetical protein [Alkalibacterium sp.]
MTRGFKKLFWGFLIVNVSLTAGLIPILPSFVGWLIVLDALADLEEQIPRQDLQFVVRSVIVLLVFSFGELFQLFGRDWTLVSHLFQFLSIFVLLLELSAFHKLLEAVARQYDRMNRGAKRDEMVTKDKWYLLLMGTSAATLTVSMTFNYLPVFVIGVGLSLAARVYLLTILYALSKEDLELNLAESGTV